MPPGTGSKTVGKWREETEENHEEVAEDDSLNFNLTILMVRRNVFEHYYLE